ncbi:MAG: hypothetical protein KGL35_05315 [Bradyrhizobium sp.]|nr:hypothetical protein [Pseudomonadota bacterium]MDE2069445.1 hypothetical protein [Bradyrhizobium sp.]MDE2468157.1 hypothetical protein [Bradyrhizobium sp.]
MLALESEPIDPRPRARFLSRRIRSWCVNRSQAAITCTSQRFREGPRCKLWAARLRKRPSKRSQFLTVFSPSHLVTSDQTVGRTVKRVGLFPPARMSTPAKSMTKTNHGAKRRWRTDDQ